MNCQQYLGAAMATGGRYMGVNQLFADVLNRRKTHPALRICAIVLNGYERFELNVGQGIDKTLREFSLL